jgi:hypothetical protein
MTGLWGVAAAVWGRARPEAAANLMWTSEGVDKREPYLRGPRH